MRKVYITLLGAGACLAAVLVLPLSIGIWLPDIIDAPRDTIAKQHLPDGTTFRVVQYWNRVDFYSTRLQVAKPDGTEKIYLLDDDDSKSWHVPLTIDPAAGTAAVTLSGDRVKVVNWKSPATGIP